MTLTELAKTADDEDKQPTEAEQEKTILLSTGEARDIVAEAADADERWRALLERNNELVRENARLLGELAKRDREMAAVREQLHNALYPKAADQ